DTSKIERRLGRLEERYPQGWSMLNEVEHRRASLSWSWNKARLRGAKLRQGAYLLRTNLDPMDPDALWRQYVQLTEVEAAFRALKSELAIRPIWHRIQRRVEAHILVAFLGYCLWVCLKQKLKVVAQSITPARALESLRSVLMVARSLPVSSLLRASPPPDTSRTFPRGPPVESSFLDIPGFPC
ncbi:MAG: hypothetical protein WCD63_17890, partial [Terrimicrobiaceae bacterium]